MTNELTRAPSKVNEAEVPLSVSIFLCMEAIVDLRMLMRVCIVR
jgi:hypothetical protein